jgi:hypothetical protein
MIIGKRHLPKQSNAALTLVRASGGNTVSRPGAKWKVRS